MNGWQTKNWDKTKQCRHGCLNLTAHFFSYFTHQIYFLLPVQFTNTHTCIHIEYNFKTTSRMTS